MDLEELDPDELVVEIESITCQALLTELFPDGTPSSVLGDDYQREDFLTDMRTGLCYNFSHLASGGLTKEEEVKY